MPAPSSRPPRFRAALIAIALLASLASAHAAVIVADEFDGAVDSSALWTSEGWSLDGSGQAWTSSDGISTALRSTAHYPAARYVIDTTLVIGIGQGPSPSNSIGVVFGQHASGGWWDGYSVSWHPGGSLVLMRDSASGDSALLDEADIDLGGRTSRWRVVRDGANGLIQVFIDDGAGFPATPQLEAVDSTFGQLGSFGLVDMSETLWPLASERIVASTLDTPIAPSVASLVLIDADRDQPIAGFAPLAEGSELNLSTLPSRRLSIRAETSPAVAGSVRFTLDGVVLRTENLAPYAIAGDAAGGADYLPWTPTLGAHVLVVTPFAGANASGAAGPARTLRFTVVDQPVIVGVDLIDADRDEVIPGALSPFEGAVNELNLGTLPSRRLSIRARTQPAPTGSVRFVLDGVQLRVENSAPYAIAGDAAGGTDYLPWTPTVGDHVLVMTPYSGSGATGRAGVPRTLRFTVVDHPAPFVLRVNFQPAGTPLVGTYVPDHGNAFGVRANGLQYGWNRDTFETRIRPAPPYPYSEARYTFNHLQKPSNPDASWEVAVPNGFYSVYVVAGDPAALDSVYHLGLEGETVVSGTPTAAYPWVDGAIDVEVTDGRLTLGNLPGARNNKVCTIEIQQVFINGNG